jgi:hypothetical protein
MSRLAYEEDLKLRALENAEKEKMSRVRIDPIP